MAEAIMAMPNRDHHEFASLIWMDANGDIHHTDITEGGPTSSQIGTNGLPNYGAAIGLIHSHAPDGGVATAREFPTLEDPLGRSDWDAFDFVMDQMATSLQNDYQLYPNGPTSQSYFARLGELRQYIMAPTGPSGSSQFVLRGYDGERRNHDLNNPGQKIPLDLHHCR